MILIRKEPLIVKKTDPPQLMVCNITQCTANQIEFTVGVIHVNGK